MAERLKRGMQGLPKKAKLTKGDVTRALIVHSLTNLHLVQFYHKLIVFFYPTQLCTHTDTYKGTPSAFSSTAKIMGICMPDAES